MPVCNLHVGSHKTGTSAIQVFLSTNREILDRDGILVPVAGTSPNGSHLPLVHSLLGTSTHRHGQTPSEMLKAEMMARPHHDVVISAEYLESEFQRHPTDHPVLQFFRAAGYDVRIILYVRNTAQLLNAQYSQRVKMFRYNGDFPEMVDRTLAKSNRGVGRWVDFVRNNRCMLVARPYTGHIQTGGLIGDFMTVLGFDWATVSGQFTLPERVNESVGPSAIAAARRIMSLLPDGLEALDKNQCGRLGRMLLEEVNKQQYSEPKFSGIDTAAARRLALHFRKTHDRFARTFWQCAWQDVFTADMAEDLVINDFAQTEMTPNDKERVATLFHGVWSRIDHVLARPRYARNNQPLRRDTLRHQRM